MRAPTLVLAVLGLALALGARAGLEDITYPITELGSCENQDACFAYCGEPTNYDACVAFAEANDLLEEEEIREYQEMQELVAQGGPGGCTSESECETYCSDLNNMNECLAFAQEHGLMDEEELEDARKVQSALNAGYSMPGGCTSEDTCEAYCQQPGNMEECLSFASAAGFMSPEEVEEARQVMTIMQSGNSPGGCQNQQECEAYCEDEANREECVAFAVEAGFLTQEEADAARNMGNQEEGEFVGPGGCTDEESCRAYCEQEVNREECTAAFGEGAGGDREGLEGEDEFSEFGEETGGDFVGPGGCTGEEECFAFCSDPANRQACGAFFESAEAGDLSDVEGEFGEPGFEFDDAQKDDWHPADEVEVGEWREPSGDEDQWRDSEAPDASRDEPQPQDEYQLEGGEAYELFDERVEDSYEFDDGEFGSFDPGESFQEFGSGDDFSDFDRGSQDGSYQDLYVDPGAGGGMPSGGEAPSGGESAPPSMDAGGEPQSAADSDATFVESVKRFLGNVLAKTRQLMAI